ncbi:hypothetical protein [Cyanobium sp. WAJ14-Wanaka]|uniref:hypothetical protein n=1 Tax=Cyanobium sp. WAJ14-Wanaka TaxID=2823725 RepID=UPI0020CCCADA|nr:hypothetical protein [Cyanobium sp. WAJ14-Wanaka]MCP9776176.1 hypothetical protein [Cyanobium sp. WAJ14-Wanaka]
MVRRGLTASGSRAWLGAFGAIWLAWAGLAPAPSLAVTGATAGASDDRSALTGFLRQKTVTNRRLLEDLDRTEYSPAELRSALLKVYSVRVEKVSAFLDSPSGRSLIERQVQGWSPWLNTNLKSLGLRAAILKASRQDALSAAGVVAGLPVRFQLPERAAGARRETADPVCPDQCGDSVLAHLAFLMASLQVGAMGR